MNVALKKAYDLEKKGLEFYIDSAVESKNTLVKRTLFSLAQEEIKHMMKIDEISSSIEAGGVWPGAEGGLKGSDIEISIKEFFQKSDKNSLREESDNAGQIKKAMEFERKSYELYADLAAKAGSDAEKSFYAELQKQEEAHYEALENVYYYLTRTGDWFGRDEAGVWNWMNL